eukprot:9477624-Pyramimonas_sp.AAC.1
MHAHTRPNHTVQKRAPACIAAATYGFTVRRCRIGESCQWPILATHACNTATAPEAHSACPDEAFTALSATPAEVLVRRTTAATAETSIGSPKDVPV